MGNKEHTKCTGFECKLYYVPDIGHAFSKEEVSCSSCFTKFHEWRRQRDKKAIESFAKQYQNCRVRVMSIVKVLDRSIKFDRVPRPVADPQPYGRIIGFDANNEILIEFENKDNRDLSYKIESIANIKLLVGDVSLGWLIPLTHLKVIEVKTL